MTYKLNYAKIFEAIKWELVAELKEEVTTHDGMLRNSISVGNSEVVGNESTGFELQLAMLNYWSYVEFGSAPHWTSVENLKKWAKDKLGDENAAYALQKYIAKYGTKPHPFIRKVIDNKLDDIIYNAIKALGADAVIKVN